MMPVTKTGLRPVGADDRRVTLNSRIPQLRKASPVTSKRAAINKARSAPDFSKLHNNWEKKFQTGVNAGKKGPTVPKAPTISAPSTRRNTQNRSDRKVQFTGSQIPGKAVRSQHGNPVIKQKAISKAVKSHSHSIGFELPEADNEFVADTRPLAAILNTRPASSVPLTRHTTQGGVAADALMTERRRFSIYNRPATGSRTPLRDIFNIRDNIPTPSPNGGTPKLSIYTRSGEKKSTSDRNTGTPDYFQHVISSLRKKKAKKQVSFEGCMVSLDYADESTDTLKPADCSADRSVRNKTITLPSSKLTCHSFLEKVRKAELAFLAECDEEAEVSTLPNDLSDKINESGVVPLLDSSNVADENPIYSHELNFLTSPDNPAAKKKMVKVVRTPDFPVVEEKLTAVVHTPELPVMEKKPVERMSTPEFPKLTPQKDHQPCRDIIKRITTPTKIFDLDFSTIIDCESLQATPEIQENLQKIDLKIKKNRRRSSILTGNLPHNRFLSEQLKSEMEKLKAQEEALQKAKAELMAKLEAQMASSTPNSQAMSVEQPRGPVSEFAFTSNTQQMTIESTGIETSTITLGGLETEPTESITNLPEIAAKSSSSKDVSCLIDLDITCTNRTIVPSCQNLPEGDLFNSVLEGRNLATPLLPASTNAAYVSDPKTDPMDTTPTPMRDTSQDSEVTLRFNLLNLSSKLSDSHLLKSSSDNVFRNQAQIIGSFNNIGAGHSSSNDILHSLEQKSWVHRDMPLAATPKNNSYMTECQTPIVRKVGGTIGIYTPVDTPIAGTLGNVSKCLSSSTTLSPGNGSVASTPPLYTSLSIGKKQNIVTRSPGMAWRIHSRCQKYRDALDDDEVAIHSCHFQSPSKSLKLRRDVIDGLAHSLSHGDDLHFIPISPDQDLAVPISESENTTRPFH